MPRPESQGSQTRQIRWAAILQLVQGVLMEGLPLLALGIVLALGIDAEVMSRGFSFILPVFNEHLYLMMAMSGIFATLRIIGSIGLLRDRMWGYALSLINCTVTLVLMIFILPAGIADGILSGAALLLLLLFARYGKAPIHYVNFLVEPSERYLPVSHLPRDMRPGVHTFLGSLTIVFRGGSKAGVSRISVSVRREVMSAPKVSWRSVMRLTRSVICDTVPSSLGEVPAGTTWTAPGALAPYGARV